MSGAGTGVAVVRLQAGRAIREALLAVLTASIAEVAGGLARVAPLVPVGTTAARSFATAILACVWLVAPDEERNNALSRF